MYFGVDPHQPDLYDLIESAVRDCIGKHGQSNVIALVDGTFDTALGQELWEYSKRSDSGVVALYDNSALSGLEECAPFLLSMSPERLSQLLAISAGKPMFSIFQTPLAIDALQRHFSAFLQIHTPSEKLHLPLRFADTTCSENVLKMFSDAQRTAFCSGFTVWHLINRKGALTTIQGTPDETASYMPPAIGEANSVEITDKQYVWLMNSSEADFILCDLAKESPRHVGQRKASVLYSMIEGLLKQLTERGINNDRDRYLLAVRSLMFSEQHEALKLLDEAQELGVEMALQRNATIW